GIRDATVTGVQTCALPISDPPSSRRRGGGGAQARERLPRRTLHRGPRRRLEGGSGRARCGVLRAARVERRPPATLVILGQLQIEIGTASGRQRGRSWLRGR